MAEPDHISLPIDPISFQSHYGSLAFGVMVFLITLGAVWWMFIRPQQERARREEDQREKHLEQIQRTAELNSATAAQLAAASASLSKLAEDFKMIAKYLDASLARTDRMLDRLEHYLSQEKE